MPTAADPLRLAWAILLCVFPAAAAYRFSRRTNPPIPAVADALLFAYAIQYLAIVPAGLAGFLTPTTISSTALALSAALLLLPRGSEDGRERNHSSFIIRHSSLTRPILLASLFFTVGYLAAYIYDTRYLPPLATDALAYHLPASVQWLQHHRIDLLPTWFFNPANTFSPLAGSVFITWLIAPLGSDVLARFVQIGPIFLIFFAILDLNPRHLAISAIVALAAVLSRPMLAEGILPKDDLFVAAFFIVAVANLSTEKLRSPLAPWRLGIFLGLLLATKYTAILSAGLLLIAADAPFRAGWRKRQWIIFLAVAFLLAAPWYMRNLILTGNPLYPIHVPLLPFPSMFIATRSLNLRSIDGLVNALAAGYFALPAILWILLTLFWLIAFFRSVKSLVRDSQRRLILVAAPVGIALFALFSPYPEVRFILPEIILLFAAIPIALAGEPALGALALIPAIISIATSFAPSHRIEIAQYTTVAAIVALVGISLWRLDVDRLGLWRGVPRVSASLALVAAFLAFNHWTDYLETYRQTIPTYWQVLYDDQGQLWSRLDADAPPDATIAYTNQFMIYPLYGFGHRRKVLYVPPHSNLKIQDLKLPERLPGEQISLAATAAANANPDRAAWLQNLRDSKAQYLIAGPDAPEVSFADSDPEEFQPLFRNSAGFIYKIAR